MDSTAGKTCTRCGEHKLLDDFRRDKGGKAGRRSRCRSCDNAANFETWAAKRDAQREVRRIEREAASNGLTKTCLRCAEPKPLLEFYKSTKTPDGRHPNCRDCYQVRRHERADMSAEAKAAEVRDLQTRATKTCTSCELELPRERFGRNKNSRDGIRGRCKACEAEWQRSHYRQTKERRAELSRAWYAANRERKNETSRAYARENRERLAAKAKEWRAAHPGFMAEFMRQRRALMAGAIVTEVDLAALWTGYCGICAAEIDPHLRHPDPRSKSVDHIIPLARGGSHTPENLQWAHLICNIRKGARMP